MVFFLSLCDPLSTTQFMETCTRLSLSEQYRKKLFEMRGRIESILDTLQRRIIRGPIMKRSEIYFLLDGLPVELLLYLMVKTKVEGVKKFISLYFTQLHGVRITVTGKDLKDLGVSPGPAFKKILDRVFRARLDDENLTRDDELRIARKEAARYK